MRLTIWPAILAATAAAAQPVAVSSDRRLGDVRMDLPLTPVRFRAAVIAMAGNAEAPLGFESADGAEVPRASGAPEQWLLLRGMSVAEALNRLVDFDPRYEWVQRDGVINVRPRGVSRQRDHFLNRRVREFRLTDTTVVDALTSIHQLQDPTYTLRRKPGLLVRPENELPAAARTTRQGLIKPVALKARNATVRDLLNLIVRAHGRSWWAIDYEGTPGAYANSRLTLGGFDGWILSSDARRYRPRSPARNPIR